MEVRGRAGVCLGVEEVEAGLAAAALELEEPG